MISATNFFTLYSASWIQITKKKAFILIKELLPKKTASKYVLLIENVCGGEPVDYINNGSKTINSSLKLAYCMTIARFL